MPVLDGERRVDDADPVDRNPDPHLRVVAGLLRWERARRQALAVAIGQPWLYKGEDFRARLR